MIENVLNGYGTKAYSVCDKMPWYNEEAVTEYDLEAAKALMEEAGWSEGDDGVREKDGEKAELREITRDLGLLPLSYNSIDFLYDDFLTVYKKCDLYSQEYLTYDQVLERRGKIKEIIEALYEGQV